MKHKDSKPVRVLTVDVVKSSAYYFWREWTKDGTSKIQLAKKVEKH